MGSRRCDLRQRQGATGDVGGTRQALCSMKKAATHGPCHKLPAMRQVRLRWRGA
jgi:hypothetical protein